MLGFCALILVMAALIWIGSYWISWEIQEVKARPRFGAKLKSDCARLLRGLRGSVKAESPAALPTAPVLARRSSPSISLRQQNTNGG